MRPSLAGPEVVAPECTAPLAASPAVLSMLSRENWFARAILAVFIFFLCAFATSETSLPHARSASGKARGIRKFRDPKSTGVV